MLANSFDLVYGYKCINVSYMRKRKERNYIELFELKCDMVLFHSKTLRNLSERFWGLCIKLQDARINYEPAIRNEAKQTALFPVGCPQPALAQGIGKQHDFEACRSTWPVLLHEGARDVYKVYHWLIRSIFN